MFIHSKAVLIRVLSFIFQTLWCFCQNPPSKTLRSLFERIFWQYSASRCFAISFVEISISLGTRNMCFSTQRNC